VGVHILCATLIRAKKDCIVRIGHMLLPESFLRLYWACFFVWLFFLPSVESLCFKKLCNLKEDVISSNEKLFPESVKRVLHIHNLYQV